MVIGEVGLAGEVRRVPNLERRLTEAARLGYENAIVPTGLTKKIPGMLVTQVGTVREAIGAVDKQNA